MRKSIIILVTILFIVGMSIATGIYVYNNILNIDTIYEGIKVDEYYLGEKTKEEALNYIKDKKDPEILEKTMNLIYEENIYKLGLDELGFKYEYELAINEAFKLGRNGTIIDKLKEIKNIKDKGKTIILKSNHEEKKVKEIVREIAKDINQDLVEATFQFNGGNFQITDETIGKDLMIDDLEKQINKNIYVLEDINIPVEETQARYKKASLSRINGVIGKYSTSFKTSSADRAENIRLSTDALNGKILLPGDEISFNEITGPRQSKYGYKEANVIISGELTPGVGGGVCQTSTTIYNALLLSDLTILERHPHSLPPAYVKYGQDAAVAYGQLDLKFRNDFDYPIYIDAKVINREVYFNIYGDLNAKNYSVKITPEIIETISPKVEELYDANLSPGSKIDIQRGRTGYKVITYKSIIGNDGKIEKKQITSDYYREKNYVYKKGPQPIMEVESKKEASENEELEVEKESENEG